MNKYLKFNEKIISRKLYEEVFSDTEIFTDFYYQEYLKKNEIIGCFKEEELVSMMHIIPNSFLIKNDLVKINYLYAVATKKEHRKKGIMGNLMTQVMSDLYEQKNPITYLVPENVDTYKKFGFATIQKKTKELAKIDRIEYDVTKISFKIGKLENIEELIVFFNEKVCKDFKFYKKRDAEYYYLLMKRLHAEQGNIELLLFENKIFGYCYVSNEEELLISELFCDDKYKNIFINYISEKYKKEVYIVKPPMMARLLRPEIIVKYITSDEKINFTFKLNDNIISQNNIVYEWDLDEKSSLIKISNEKPDYYIEVSDFIEWIFGCKKYPDLPKINPINEILLNEIL